MTPPVTAACRVDDRTKRLLTRLQPGEIAVIDHIDLDRVAAEGLVLARAGAVVNAAPSISGTYPNEGPLLLAAAGIPIIDDVGREVMTTIREGQVVTVRGNEVMRNGIVVAKGERQDLQTLEALFQAAKKAVGPALAQFAENTLEYIQQERHLLTDAPDLPDVGIDFRGRHVLIVVRGQDYREDLAALRRTGYLAEVRPVVIGVDGGADALMAVGVRPDLIVGDFDSVSVATLRTGAKLVVHAYPDGRAPGAARLDELGLEYTLFEATGTSEDIAMILAYEEGAELICAVGTHSSLADFLDKGRAGMASTFLVRLKVGPILVDAKGVNRLYQSRVRKRDLAALVLSAIFTLVVVTIVSEPIRLFLRGVALSF